MKEVTCAGYKNILRPNPVKKSILFYLFEDLKDFCQQTRYHLRIHNRDGQEIFAGCLLVKLLNDVQSAVISFRIRSCIARLFNVKGGPRKPNFLGKICESYEFVHAYVKIGEKERLKLVRSIRSTTTNHFEDIKPELTDELVKKVEETIGETECNSNREKWAKDLKSSSSLCWGIDCILRTSILLQEF